MKLYAATTTTDYAAIVEEAIPDIFTFECPVSAWDNDQVEESKVKTDAEIEALNEALAFELKKAILLEHIHKTPVMDLEKWKWELYAKWNNLIPYYNEMFIIQLDKFQWRTFYDYDIHRESTEVLDGENTTTSSADNLSGDYPNAGTDAFATSESTNTSNSSGTVDNTTTSTSREYRIGATGKTPVNLQKEAYDNIKNICKLFAEEFDDLFYFNYEGWCN